MAKAELFLYLLRNGERKPDGGMFGASYRDVYVVAASSDEHARQLAAERCGDGRVGAMWSGPGTKSERIGKADASEPGVLYPSPRDRDNGIY